MTTYEITSEFYEADYGYHSYKLIYMDSGSNFQYNGFLILVGFEQDIEEFGESIREDRDALASDIGD